MMRVYWSLWGLIVLYLLCNSELSVRVCEAYFPTVCPKPEPSFFSMFHSRNDEGEPSLLTSAGHSMWSAGHRVWGVMTDNPITLSLGITWDFFTQPFKWARDQHEATSNLASNPFTRVLRPELARQTSELAVIPYVVLAVGAAAVLVGHPIALVAGVGGIAVCSQSLTPLTWLASGSMPWR